jgi:hypothetical protein
MSLGQYHIHISILSDKFIGGEVDIETLIQMLHDPDIICDVVSAVGKEVHPKLMAELLRSDGSDPSFFGIQMVESDECHEAISELSDSASELECPDDDVVCVSRESFNKLMRAAGRETTDAMEQVINYRDHHITVKFPSGMFEYALPNGAGGLTFRTCDDLDDAKLVIDEFLDAAKRSSTGTGTVKLVSFTSESLIPFVVREVAVGGRYGADMVLINDSGDTLIELYDARYKFCYDFLGAKQDAIEEGATCLGQFVTRYCRPTFLSAVASGWGLNMMMGTTDWCLTKNDLQVIAKLLDQE